MRRSSIRDLRARALTAKPPLPVIGRPTGRRLLIIRPRAARPQSVHYWGHSREIPPMLSVSKPPENAI